jgi:cytochrome c oxidase cbb3-type subunit III
VTCLMPSARVLVVLFQRKTTTASLLSRVVVACCLATGCAKQDSKLLNEPSPIEALAVRNLSPDPVVESQSRGAKAYKHYCSICHGDEGKGDGFNSTNLAVSPRNFSAAQFWRQATDEQLLLTVSKGGPAVGKSVLMPAWGHTLTDRNMRDIVAFLHTLAEPNGPTDDDSGRPTG